MKPLPANRQRRGVAEGDVAAIWSLDFRAIWFRFWAQPAAFVFLCGYYFIEYVRPQTIYPIFDFLPYGTLTLALTLLAWPNAADWRGLKSPHTFFIALFWVVLLLSWTRAIDLEAANDRLYIYLNWLLVFVLTVTIVTTRERFFIFLLLFFLWNLKMSQHGAITWASRGFGFAGWGIAGPQGWFQNSGEFGALMVMFAMMSWGYWCGARDYMTKIKARLFLLLPITAAMSVLASNSRGDILAGFAAVAWFAVLGGRLKVKTLVFGVFILALGYSVLPEGTLERFQTAGEDNTSISRLMRWDAGLQIAADNPLLGIGPAQWMVHYPAKFPREPGREGWGIPHNFFVDALAGFGYTGFTIVLLMLLFIFVSNAKTRKIARQIEDPVTLWTSRGLDAATVGFIAAGFFMSVLYYPFLWVHIAMAVALHRSALNALEEPRPEQTGSASHAPLNGDSRVSQRRFSRPH